MTDPVPSRDWAKRQSPRYEDIRQVVMTDGFWEAFVDWVYDRGLTVFPIPVGDPDDVPTFGIGVQEWMFDRERTVAEDERRTFEVDLRRLEGPLNP